LSPAQHKETSLDPARPTVTIRVLQADNDIGLAVRADFHSLPAAAKLPSLILAAFKYLTTFTHIHFSGPPDFLGTCLECGVSGCICDCQNAKMSVVTQGVDVNASEVDPNYRGSVNRRGGARTRNVKMSGRARGRYGNNSDPVPGNFANFEVLTLLRDILRGRNAAGRLILQNFFVRTVYQAKLPRKRA
jgi:hypothetical protein